MDNENENVEVEEIDEALEQEAISMGWQPKDKFPGNPDKWTPAAEYVERGRHLIPIITENNRRLKNELLTTTKKLDRMTQDHEKSIRALEDHFAKVAQQAVADAKRALKEQLREARESGDVDLEVETLDKLQELKNPDATSGRHEPQVVQAGLSPEFEAWQSENPWFGVDKVKTDTILGIAKDLRDSGDTTPGAAFFEKCTTILRQKELDSPPPVSRVEAGNRSGGRSSRGKSFADLPQEAKQACWADVDTLVGSNKVYKTKAEWEKAYANIYFGSDE